MSTSNATASHLCLHDHESSKRRSSTGHHWHRNFVVETRYRRPRLCLALLYPASATVIAMQIFIDPQVFSFCSLYRCPCWYLVLSYRAGTRTPVTFLCLDVPCINVICQPMFGSHRLPLALKSGAAPDITPSRYRASYGDPRTMDHPR